MIQQLSQGVVFVFHYTAGGLGKTGLSPLVDVFRPDGTKVVSDGAATEIGDGLYQYPYSGAGTTTAGNYYAVAKTSDTSVDQRHLPSLWVVGASWVERLDTPLSTLATAISGVAAAAATAVWAAATRTLTAISDSTGVTTLLDRLTSGRAANLDNLENLDAAVSDLPAAVWQNGSRTLTAGGGGGGGGSAAPLINVGANYPNEQLRLTAGDTGGGLIITIRDDNGTPIPLGDDDVVVARLRKVGAPTGTEIACVVIYGPGGIIKTDAWPSEVSPVPEAGDYELTTQRAGFTNPAGRRIPVRIIAAL
jgi:hypothetical protein